jgi:hypothetical protein
MPKLSISLDITSSPVAALYGSTAAYVAGGYIPNYTADFVNDYYRTGNGTRGFSNTVTHSASGLATMTGGYGPELVSNGGFDSDSDWTKGTGWTISGGKLNSTATSGTNASQNILTSGKSYQVTYEITDYVSGQVRVNAGWSGYGTYRSSEGVFTEVLECSGNTFIEVTAHSSGFVGSIDNISVREIPKLQWRPHNLLTYSEQFDNAAWVTGTAGTGSVTKSTADADIAPDGTLTADRVIFDLAGGTTTGDQALLRQANATTGSLTHSVYLRSSDGLSSYTMQIIKPDGSALNITVTGSWQKFEVSGTSSGSINYGVRLRGGQSPANSDYADVLIWGAHLYRSDLGGMVDNPDRGDSYVPTTTSARYLPRIGHHVYNGSQWVDEGVFHESEARTNLFVQSNDFSTQSAVRSTITDNSSTSPDGTVSAARFEDTATSGDHRLDFTTFTVTSGNTYTYSIFAKAAELDWVRMWFSSDFGTQYANFDLSTGSIGVTTGIISANIEPVSNGFYRCSIVGTATSTGSNNQRLQLATDDNMVSFTGDGASGVLIYGAQFEAGSTPSSYIPTSGATATRAAETLTIPYENLTWPEPVVIGDELVTNGTFDADTDWTKGTDWAFDAVNLRAERTGTTYQNLQQALTLSTGEAYVFSFTKGGAGLVQAFLDGKTFNATAAGEYVFTFVYSGGSTNLQFGTNSADVDIDNVSVREINPLSVSFQMDGRITYADEGLDTQASFYRWWFDSNNRIRARLYTAGSDTGGLVFRQVTDGVGDQAYDPSSYSPGVLVPFNIASRHGSTFINGAVDGVALTEDTTPVALPDLSTTDLQLGYDFMGTIKKFRMWADDIGDTGIEEATEPSLEPSLSLTFDGSSTSFTVFDWSE